MARLLGKPEGELGRSVGEMLNRVNANITTAVYQHLRLEQGDRVLEIGFGNGKLLPALLACADGLSYVGIDIADTMVTEAIAFNAEPVAAGRASFSLASAEAIPCADQSFDRVFAVNVIYFWTEPVRALAEMRRVLRLNGISVVASAVSGPGEEPPPFARAEFGFHRRDRDTVAVLHREAGFRKLEVHDFEEMITLPDGAPRKRRYAIFVACP